MVFDPWPSWVRSSSLCWRSWAALGAYVGGLGRSWDVCWRSWAALGRKRSKNITNLKVCLFPRRERDLRPRGGGLGLYVADVGPPLGPLLAILGRFGLFVGGRGLSWPENRPKPDREGPRRTGNGKRARPVAESSYRFVLWMLLILRETEARFKKSYMLFQTY